MAEKKDRKWAKPLGFLVIILAIVGVVFIVLTVVKSFTAK